MAKYWVWQLDDDADVIAGTLKPSVVENVSFEDDAAEDFVERHWSYWDYTDYVDVVVLRQVDGRTFKKLLNDRNVWTVRAQETVTFRARLKEDEDV